MITWLSRPLAKLVVEVRQLPLRAQGEFWEIFYIPWNRKLPEKKISPSHLDSYAFSAKDYQKLLCHPAWFSCSVRLYPSVQFPCLVIASSIVNDFDSAFCEHEQRYWKARKSKPPNYLSYLALLFLTVISSCSNMHVCACMCTLIQTHLSSADLLSSIYPSIHQSINYLPAYLSTISFCLLLLTQTWLLE